MAGLVVITPCAGFVSPGSAMIVGVLAGVVPYLACVKLKQLLKYDDALDTFGIHGVGGTMGALLAGVFASADINGNLNTNLKDLVGQTLWLEQLKAIGLTIALAVVGTTVVGLAIKALIGLRADKQVEESGLDETEHGEVGYHDDELGRLSPDVAVSGQAPAFQPAPVMPKY